MHPSPAAPKGWSCGGSHPGDYEVEVEQAAYEGKPAAVLRASDPARGFGSLSQAFMADAYRGKRIRLSAAVRSRDVQRWAGLWMRVDGFDRRVLAFDNMQARPITGTSGWTTHAVVLDVAENASDRIAFGVLLSGPGHVWIADVKIEEVGPSVPTTLTSTPTPVHDHPVNLDFTG